MFLELPQELRDLIYQYVFEDRSDINLGRHVFATPPLRASTSIILHANQLKFVCRRLRDETSILAPGWRGLTIKPNGLATGSLVLSAFLQRCSVFQQKNITRITIIQAKDGNRSNRLPFYRQWFRLICGAQHPLVYDFCAAHPNARVVVRYPFLNYASSPYPDKEYILEWTVQHACLRMTLRGGYGISFSDFDGSGEEQGQRYSELSLANLFLNKPLSERHTVQMEGALREVLDNLRIIVSTTFDEEIFRILWRNTYQEGNVDLEARLEEMRKLFAEGC